MLAQGPHEVGPGIEVIDYRTIDSAGVIDWVADNSTVAYAVVGSLTPVAETDPATIEASLSCAGGQLGAGRGDQVMGNPLAAVAWLSGHLVEKGRRLERGQVVLTGSLTGHHAVAGAVECAADFGELGGVSLRFEA
jgi:2-keto-4-pentenoate hydratase